MAINPDDNNLDVFGHTHDEVQNAEIIPFPSAASTESLDRDKIVLCSAIGGVGLGMLGERAALMSSYTEDINLEVGVGVGVTMALIVAAYGVKKFKKIT